MANSSTFKWRWFPRLKWLLPLLVLLVLKALMLSMLLSGVIKGNVAEATGIAEDRIDVNGRNVVIDGFTSQADADAAGVIAADDVAWTADIETIVDGDASTSTQTSASSVQMVTGATDVVLTGAVGSEETRDALVAGAKEEFEPDLTVVDELTVDDSVGDDDGQVVIVGTADDEAQKADWVTRGTAAATAAGFTFDEQVDVAEAEEEEAPKEPVDALNELFELEPIEFDTSQTTIRPESEATLDKAAELINASPDAGTFRVVGHTDGDGGESFNLALSEGRAKAVVDYLVNTGEVDAERLESEGKGESDLKVSPEESPEDKQQNRRIEWVLV